MDTKSIVSKLFKIFIITLIIITNSLIQPLSFTKIEADAATTDNNWLSYKLDGFSGDTVNQLFDVLGSAGVPEGQNFIRLTSASQLQSGAVITKNNFCPKDNYSFSTALSFKIGNTSPDGPSDGFTFTLQADPTNPLNNGGSLGVYGTDPSFSIKYDTFKNDVYNDPSDNNISLTVDGSPYNNDPSWYTDLNQYNTTNGTNYVLSNGTQYYTWIDYDGLNQNVQVRLGTSPDRASSQVVLDVNNIDLGTVFNGDRFYASFTGTTGSPNYETHDIYNWYFVNQYAPISTLNAQNDYRQAPSSMDLTTVTDNGYNATVTLLDPLGNPVQGASLDSFTSTIGELTGPNGEAVTDLVSDADGKIQAVLNNAGHNQEVTLSAAYDCLTDSTSFTSTNQPPTAPDDTKTTSVNEPVSGQVVGKDLDGDSLTYQTGNVPSNGTVTVNEDGTWTYIPNPDYVGDDTFTVIVSDEYGGTVESTITIHVTPEPILESKKSSSIQAKADGNTDASNPEVGDTLLYTIQTRNTVENSLVQNLTISDTIPAGLTYVSGSLTVDGQAVTDSEGDDKGHTANGDVVGQFGDVTDTEWHTLTFQVTVNDDQAGQTISNTAVVQGDNVATPDEPSTKVTINPQEETNVCPAPVALINGSFEEPPGRGSLNGSFGYFEHEVPGWETTDTWIEIWDYAEGYPSPTVNQQPAPVDGNRYAEINASENGMLYQDVKTTPGQTIYWRFSHKGLYGEDTMQLRIGPATDNPYETSIIEQMSDGNTAWGTYTGTYTVPAGQTMTRFGFEAVSTSNGSIGHGNHIDDIFLGTEPCVVAEKTVSPEGVVNAGDELTYEVNVKNNGGDIAANAIFEDAIPEGTEYFPGSLKITNGTGTIDLTDADDSDAGHFDGQKVIVKLGDLPNTNDLPNGITVQFKVKALVSDTITQVVNKAQINYKNLLTSEDEVVVSNETTTPLTYQKPVLKSEKSATIKQKADGNTDTAHPEVGDKLLYTIQTQNTVSNSLLKNMTIKDKLPEGLEYVQGTLKVDGVAATDDEGDDNGHYVDGTFTGQFGDILDTDVHKIEFEVKVLSGQAGQDIVNIATVSGDNLDEPSRPENEVKVYPRLPVLESDKTATNLEDGKEVFEVGDTIVYTIKTRNTVSDGVVTALTISDTIPAGLTYVAGSLKTDGQSATDADDTDNGHVVNNAVEGTFGDVTDTEWHTVEFQAKINSGQSEQAIKNIATVEGGNIDTPDKPEETVNVTPKKPNLVSEKTYTIQEKAAENTDTEHPEVGDTLLYTIKTQNTIEDSLVENMVITDKLPEGLEYVPGSLKVDGVAVTDAEGDDNGHYVNSTFSGQIGDVRDTAEHKIEFLVKVQSGQAGKDIVNIATISGDNLGGPSRPETEVKVYPRLPVLESEKTATNLEAGKEIFEVGDTVVYTIKTRNTVSDGVVTDLKISDTIPAGLTYVAGTLKIDGQSATDTVGDDNGHVDNNAVEGTFGDVTDTEWHTVEFQAKIDSGQSEQAIKNIATVEGGNIDIPDKPEETVNVTPKKPNLVSEKTYTIQEKAAENTDTEHPEVGDTLLYTIKTQNTIEDSLVENMVITDKLPEGLEYVPGSLKVDGVTVTDAAGDDNGHYVNSTFSGQISDVRDTAEHKIEFLVKVQSGQAGKDIVNIATISGDNLDEPSRPETEVKVYPRLPVLESEKTATNLEAGKETYEVGDTIEYTIKTRNTVSEGVVENLVISDTIPEGLEYVPGTLKVDGTVVTDIQDGDNGHSVDGQLAGQFGDVTDTEWHTVTFHAKVKQGQAGKVIQNTAAVDGDNIDIPDEPTTEVDINTSDITLSKVADKEFVHVGDIVTYTIEAINGETGAVWNGTIEDQLPANVELVSGSTTLNGKALADGDVWNEGQLTVKPVTVKASETATITFQVKILESALNTTVENIATGHDPEQPMDPIETTPTGTEVVSSAGELSSAKAVFNSEGEAIDGQKVKVGDELTYKITAKNIKDATTIVNNVKVVDDIPAGLSYVPGTLTVNGEAKDDSAVNGQVVTVDDIGSLKGGEKVEVAFTVTVTEDAKGEITNIATVEGTVPGGNPGDPEQPDEPQNPGTDVKVPADITLSKVADKQIVHVGDIVTYTIEAKNGETGGVWNGTIQDQLPANIELVSGSTTLNGKALVDGDVWNEDQLTVNPVTVKAGETAIITFQVKVLEGALNSTVENIATAYDPDQPLDPDEPGKDPSDPITTPPTGTEVVSSAGELSSAKAVFNSEGEAIDGQKVKVGDQLTYKITVENIKDVTTIVNKVKVVDDIPAGLSYFPGTLTVNGEAKDDSAVNGQVVTIADIGSLKGGEKVDVAFTVTVTENAKGEITNIATVEGTVPGKILGDLDQPEEPQNSGTDVKVLADQGEPADTSGEIDQPKEPQKLPQTGEKQTQTGFMMVIGLLMIGVSLFGFLKKKKTYNTIIFK